MIIGMIVNGQVAIGKKVTNTSAILDFKEGTTSGIILSKIPDFYNLPANTPKGMIFYDCRAKLVFLKSGNGRSAGNYRLLSNPFQGRKSVCNNISSKREIGNGIIIGANTSTAKGVLVLESNNKALLLPRVANAYDKIKSPEPGTLVYDPANKVLSIYNGETWAFWSN